MSNYPTCTYIKTYGTICKSPALTGSEMCYYHGRDQKRVENLSRAQGYKAMDGVNGFLRLQRSIRRCGSLCRSHRWMMRSQSK